MNNFLVNMSDGSERLIQVCNRVDYEKDLVITSIFYENLLTAVMDARQEYFCHQIILARMDDNSKALIYHTLDEDNSILFMEVPQCTRCYLSVKWFSSPVKTPAIDKIVWSDTPVIFTHLSELEYTFM